MLVELLDVRRAPARPSVVGVDPAQRPLVGRRRDEAEERLAAGELDLRERVGDLRGRRASTARRSPAASCRPCTASGRTRRRRARRVLAAGRPRSTRSPGTSPRGAGAYRVARRARLPGRARCRPRRLTTTSRPAMARKATSSFARTLAGTRATTPPSRTRGTPGGAHLRRRAALRAPRAQPSRMPEDTALERRGRPSRVRDQPLPVDLLQGVRNTGEGHHRRCLRIDVIALEVHRRLVTVQVNLDLVRRRVRLPVVGRHERLVLGGEPVPDLGFAGQRLLVDVEDRARGPQGHHQFQIVGRRGPVELHLDLVDLVEVGLPLQRGDLRGSTAGGAAEGGKRDEERRRRPPQSAPSALATVCAPSSLGSFRVHVSIR